MTEKNQISVPNGVTLITGGARSGKSGLAQRLGQSWDGPVWVIATATAGDADMAARIERHKNERPKEWVTAETALSLTSAFKEAPDNALVILDCVTMWVSNCLCNEFDIVKMERETLALVSTVSQREAPVVIVTNEVGLGIVPENEIARLYQDMLGRVNQALAQASERVLFLSAGRVTQLEKIEDVF